MTMVSYKVGDIKKLIRESAQEFKPVLGNDVQSKNKTNNDKSYKDAEKAVKDFDGGLGTQKKGKLEPKMDANHTTLDYNPRIPASKEFKDKIKVQAQGYTSTLEKDNKIEKAAEFDNDSHIFNQLKDHGEKLKKEKEDLAHSGLQSKELPKEKKETMYESTKPKRLVFKHTKFLNESQMLTRIPEEYKRDGQTIYMKDKIGNEYTILCEKNMNGNIETNIIGFNNKEIMNEQISRIEQLMNYTPGNYSAQANRDFHINENQNFQDMMNIARGKK